MLSIYERCYKCLYFSALFSILILFVPSPAQSKELLKVGVLFDGATDRRQVFLDQLQGEVERLLGSAYEVKIPSENVLSGKWSSDRIRKNYHRLVATKDVRIIVGAGVMTAAVLTEIQHFAKPVIAVGAVNGQDYLRR